ncbi:MAG: ComF family protein [Candidatus Omnitrophica bacterium]|nr:ComF family protein [Candidatus Omnitrophota bacterium]
MKELIPSFKFQNKTSLRKTFSHIAHTFLNRYSLHLKEFDAIIPMPLTPTRLRERGYNQALLLAEGLSQILHLPCLTDQLERIGHSTRQSDLGEKERWTNVRGAFRMKPLSTVKDKKIILVDDLLTTGATASEAAHVLKTAGAVKVGIIVLSLA